MPGAYDDAHFMAQAVRLALAQVGRTGENPAVGCVIAREGVVLSEGATGDGGRPHAEEIALAALGGRAPGATAYVTLEPCLERSDGSPSCSQRLIAAGVSRIVWAFADPHPKGAGGLARLAQAGLVCEAHPVMEAREALYGDFFRRVSGQG